MTDTRPIDPSQLDAVAALLNRIRGVLDLIARSGPASYSFDGIGSVRWQQLQLPTSLSPATLDIREFDIRADVLPDFPVAGSLRLVVQGGDLQPGSALNLTQPEPINLNLDSFSLDADCITLAWNEGNLNRWLRKILGDLADEGPAADTRLGFRLIFGGERKEIRLEWDAAAGRPFALPGVKLSVPAGRFALVLGSEDGGLFNRLSLLLTLQAGATATASSAFAWGRDEQRELQNEPDGDAEPVFKLTLTASQGFTVALMQLRLDELAAPRFLRRLPAILPPLSDGGDCAPTPLENLLPLTEEFCAVDFDFNAAALKLPFLNDEAGEGQFLTVRLDGEPQVSFAEQQVTVPLGITLKIGSLEADTAVSVGFDWEDMALVVDHSKGIELTSADDAIDMGEFLGLGWRITGAEIAAPAGQPKRYHYFTIATANFDYQVQQAPGAALEVSYDKVSQEPLTFRVSNFVLRSKGISLKAEVTGNPVRLLGVDTKFRFENSGFTIVDNVIQDFTLAGSGALPPDLVGESEVEAALQFAQEGGGLVLKSGAAALKGKKLLDCKGTRFQFSVDAVSLKFVNEGRYHLYFTLSGRAQFKLGAGDDKEGLLALLPNITIEMVDCPLAGDISVLARHVRFLIELPKPLSFSLFGAFTMELRGFGFLPAAEFFDGDAAMWLSGQIKFAQGPGDVANNETDYHSLFIGLPEPGKLLPRVRLEQLAVDVSMGDAFKLYAMVKVVDTAQEKGFKGEGELHISGLPTLKASFAFLRVRRDADGAWLRAWFIYAEVGELSLMIPVVQIYIREIGFGLGYRYTIAAIKAADETNDVRALLKELDVLSRTQGDLSKVDRWAVDLERPDQGPRWTLVLRALISQTSASPPTSLNRIAERDIACLFLFDAVLALRSDLTFFMVARGWLNTNYVDYVEDVEGLKTRPLATAYILLSPAQKRLIVRAASNPNGFIGSHPNWSDFVKDAIRGVSFTATLLVEPGLVQLDLGWPNKLRWALSLGPLSVEVQGGFIFRVSREELVIGVSYLARGRLSVEAGVSIGVAGVRVTALAEVSYGMRLIGVLSLVDPADQSLFYGAIGFEIFITFSIEFWIKLLFVKKSFRLSLGLIYSAGLEVGLAGAGVPGLRGRGTLGVRVMGRTFRIDVEVSVNSDTVEAALRRTEKYLALGLDVSDTDGPPDPVPGTQRRELGAGGVLGAAEATARAAELILGEGHPAALPDLGEVPAIAAPHYTAFAVRADDALAARRAAAADDGEEPWSYLVIFPRGELPPDLAEAQGHPQRGFLPVPPAADLTPEADFTMALPAADGLTIEQFVPGEGWVARDSGGSFSWRADWEAQVVEGEPTGEPGDSAAARRLRAYLGNAFVGTEAGAPRDPAVPERNTALEDPRVQSPAESDFEAAVRGAFEQFEGAPFFKHDPSLAYDSALEIAFQQQTSIYAEGGSLADETAIAAAAAEQSADQVRGVIFQDIVGDLRDYAAREDEAATAGSLAFQMGLVFRFRGAAPAWLSSGEQIDPAESPTISQRVSPTASGPDGVGRRVFLFNPPEASFQRFPPTFGRVRSYSSASTIAITWDLAWEQAPPGCSGCQAEPEEHLAHYRVLRRALDSAERDVTYTVKGAEVLRRTGDADGELLQRLRPRFQIVDRFEETAQDQARLPAEGRSYLYSVTPVDVAGNPGRPLSLVVTRRPDQPPAVPADAALRLVYRVEPEQLAAPEGSVAEATPGLIAPDHARLEWSEPELGRATVAVATAGYRLYFRRSATLPVGSYGLDNHTQRGRESAGAAVLGRPLPTDRRLDLPLTRVLADGGSRAVILTRADLEAAGLLPPAGGAWRAESWEIFIQAIGVNEVPSTLAPVQYVLELARPGGRPAPDPLRAEELREERRPPELELLPLPQNMPLIRPEDERASVGLAHVPMPAGFTFDGSLPVRYRQHPGLIRALRFRWNQGPSARPGYPIDLHAGYELLELDADAHPGEALADAGRLAELLRRIQEIQVVPAGDLPFLPGDTLTTSEWEAWYPSTVERRFGEGEGPPEGSEASLRPWFSWRESQLEWPQPQPGFGQLHAALERIVDRLDGRLLRIADPPFFFFGLVPLFVRLDRGEIPAQLVAGLALTAGATVATVRPGAEWRIEDPSNETVFYARPDADVLGRLFRITRLDNVILAEIESPYVVDSQVTPPAQAANLEAFLDTTAPKGDPYGWQILGQLGLSTAFALRDARSGRPVSSEELLSAVQQAIDVALPEESPLRRHLFVEALFQPGRAFELAEADADPEGLLATVQLSLRPALRQALRYRKARVSGPAGATITLTLEMPAGYRGSLIARDEPPPDQADVDTKSVSGQTELSNQGGAAALARKVVRLPLTGALTLLLRDGPASGLDTIGVEAEPELLAQITVEPFVTLPATAEESVPFSAPLDAILADMVAGTTPWAALRLYIARIANTLGPLSLPASEAELKPIAARLLIWLQRFFDHGGVTAAGDDGLEATSGGPWLATGYPRSGTPAYASPDAAGRLTYHHLVPDRWAHALRYYIQPYGRYRRLYDGLRESPVFLPAEPPDNARPLTGEVVTVHGLDVDGGGLDVVIERIQPIVAPLVLASARLDEPGEPGSPAPPGATWEVIVAQHPEQALVERNATLLRRLAFRQIAFSLMRRFAYAGWAFDTLGLAEGQIAFVETDFADPPLPPASYPPRPDHIDLAELAETGGDEARLAARGALRRSLDLPLRLGAFQRGAIALQWEGLPFYYEHRLLLIAQTASTVSPVNSVTQRDFAYRTPLPAASVSGVLAPARLDAPPFGAPGGPAQVDVTIRQRRIRIPLRRFWDSLPDEARGRWPDENPGVAPYGEQRRLSSLPDPEVVYQLVELFSGNIEVQAEFFFDQAAGAYAVRQLGRRFIAAPPGLDPELGPHDGDYTLVSAVYALVPEALGRAYDKAGLELPAELAARVAVEGNLLTVAGTLNAGEHKILRGRLDRPDQAILDALFESWYSVEPVTAFRVSRALPGPLREALDSPEPLALELVWGGLMDEAQAFALRRLPGDSELVAACGRLADRALKAQAAISVREPVSLEPGELPALPPQIFPAIDEASGLVTALEWRGPIAADQLARLAALEAPPALRETLALLGRGATAATAALVARESAPRGVDQPPALNGDAAAVFSRLQVQQDAEQRRYTGLTWAGAAFDADLELIRPALGRWAQLPELRAALDALFKALDERVVSRRLTPGRPSPEELAAAPGLGGKLRYAGSTLLWAGPAPSDAERAALLAFPADRAFVEAVARIIGRYDQRLRAPLPPRPAPDPGEQPPPPSLPPDTPPILSGKLVVQDVGQGNFELVWLGQSPETPQGRAPTDAERATLAGFAWPEPIAGAVAALLAELDQPRQSDLGAPPRRPTQAELDQRFGGRLVITAERLSWTGRIRSQPELAQLNQLANDPLNDGDPADSEEPLPFRQALAAIIAAVNEGPVSVPLSLPFRPQPEELPEELQGQLLLGRALIRHHGLMTLEEGRALRAHYARPAGDGEQPPAPADLGAIERLYGASQAKGLRGRQLMVRARRASAAPSPLRPLDPEPLVEAEEEL